MISDRKLPVFGAEVNSYLESAAHNFVDEHHILHGDFYKEHRAASVNAFAAGFKLATQCAANFVVDQEEEDHCWLLASYLESLCKEEK